MDLLRDIHSGLEPPVKYSKISFIRGSYSYYHYLCDKTDDKGWGCGYRTLQTICSWIIEQQKQKRFMKVPSIKEIQRALVEIGDKEDDFIESKEWIGTVEVAYVIDHIYEIPCRIMHNRSLKDLKDQANNILQHFEEYGSPIMMGGDRDCSSKGILGICENQDEIYLLILDPHFCGKAVSKKFLQETGWITWQNINSLDHSSFYNLCCPLIKTS